MGGNHVLLGLGGFGIGLIELHALLRLRRLHGLRRGNGMILVFFDDADHHALHVVELAVVFAENRLRAGYAAEIEVFQAAIHHDAQLLQRLIALSRFEADTLFDDGTEALPRAPGGVGIPAAHAAKLWILTLPFQRKLPLVHRVVHEKSDGIHVRRRGKLTVPVELRGHKLQLLPLPWAFPRRAEGDFPLLAEAYIFGIDAASAPSRPHLGNHRAAEIRDKGAKLLLIHLREFLSESFLRFK